jgi:hypothetical protein
MNRDSFKTIIRETAWINAFDEDFELQNANGALLALFSINVDKESSWRNIPKNILNDGCIDFFVNNKWQDYQFIDETVDLDTATLCRWIIMVLRSSD